MAQAPATLGADVASPHSAAGDSLLQRKRNWRQRQWRTHGNWEPLMFLYRRGDGAIRDLEELWRQMHSPRALDRIAELGANTCHLYFHKGYGLDHERQSIEQAAAWARRLRGAGARIGAYIGCTFFPEAFGQEATERLAMKHGAGGWSGSQYFRRFWCWNNPQAIVYIQRVVDVALDQLGADVLHFDSGFAMPHDQMCHCEHCLRLFTQYLRDEIPQMVKASGYDEASLLSPPPLGRLEHLASLTELREPGEIAWTLFHAWAGHRGLRTLAEYARSRRSDVAVLYNGANLCGITPYSRPNLEMGNLSLVDVTAVEDDLENPIGVTGDGMPISRFRIYKAASRRGVRVYCYTTGPAYDARLPLAEAAVFNHACLGMVELAMQSNRRIKDERELAFLRDLTRDEDLFLDREHRHDVAVLRHDRSALLNPFPCALSPYVVEQMLFESHVPFGIIGELDLTREALSCYRGIIVPDARCLSDAQAMVLADHVARGGWLLSIGCTGRATPLNQFRPDWALAPLLGEAHDAPDVDWLYEEVPGIPANSAGLHDLDGAVRQARPRVLQAALGSGRVVHLERLLWTAPPDEQRHRFAGFPWYSHPWWQPPANAQQFRDLVSDLQGDLWTLRADLPRHVGLESYRTASGYRVHGVNYRPSQPVGAFTLRVRADLGQRINGCRWHVPGCVQDLPMDRDGAGVTVRVPGFDVLGTLVCTVSSV